MTDGELMEGVRRNTMEELANARAGRKHQEINPNRESLDARGLGRRHGR